MLPSCVLAGFSPSSFFLFLFLFLLLCSSLLFSSSQTSGQVLGKLASLLPELIGGSADLTPSNLTAWKGSKVFQKVRTNKHSLSNDTNATQGNEKQDHKERRKDRMVKERHKDRLLLSFSY